MKTENVQILFKGVCGKNYAKCLRKNCAKLVLPYRLSKAFKPKVRCIR